MSFEAEVLLAQADALLAFRERAFEISKRHPEASAGRVLLDLLSEMRETAQELRREASRETR